MRLSRPVLGSVLAACVAVLVAAPTALACPMCEGAIGGDDRLGRAFSVSILFLMAAPYTLAAIVGGLVIYMYRRAPGRRGAVVDLTRAAHFLGGRAAPNSEGEVS
jgi:hypothetical protein